MTTYSVDSTSPYWVHVGFEPPFREFFIEVLDAEPRKLLELVGAASLWTDLDRADFDEMFELDNFPVGHPSRKFLRLERIVYRGAECKIVQRACPGSPCSGLPSLELVVASAPERYVAQATMCPCGALQSGETGVTTINERTHPGVTELLADAGVIASDGRQIWFGNVTRALVQVTEPATRVYLDPEAKPGWECWRLLTHWGA
jgi:hypothetical protein